MVKKKGVSVIVDEDFFKVFERERQKEQMKLRQTLGGTFNLGQQNFTSMLSKRNFSFAFPKPIRIRRRRKSKR